MCEHTPTCPAAAEDARLLARRVAGHPEQGWSRLCNGVILFEDTGALLPDGRVLSPDRGPDRRSTARAGTAARTGTASGSNAAPAVAMAA